MNKKFTLVFYPFIFLAFLAFFSSCEVIDRDEEIPSYIHIDSISVIADPAQGSNSSRITDAWVYIDNDLVGVFELPVTFPVLKSGSHEILVRAGIKMNGIAATRTEYPFYNFYSTIADLKKGSKITLTPTVKYFPAIQFPFIEDFESTGFNFTSSSNSDTSLQITNTEVFEGAKSGAAYLDPAKAQFQCLSSSSFTFPISSDVYLELNYKCNNEFVVGVFKTSNSSILTSLNINPSSEWKKIYINLTNEVRSSPGSSFKLFIGMFNNFGVSNPQLFIDNVKLVHQ